MARRGRWVGNVLILQNSAVASVLETAGREWEAWGCNYDWMDVELGIHPSKSAARKACEDWVREEEANG